MLSFTVWLLAHSLTPWRPWANAIVRRPSSVCPTVNILHKSLLLAQANCSIATKLAHDGPQKSLHPGCAQVQGRGERSRDTSTFGISQKSLTQPFPNFSFPLSIRFSSASQFPTGCEFRHRWPTFAGNFETVCQTVCYRLTVRSGVLSLRALHFVKRHWTILPD